MVPAVRSTIDVAMWLLYRADSAGERLQPQKLQRLLYLAQAHFAGERDGAKLMPATFIAAEVGPVEPNVYYLFEHGAPALPLAALNGVSEEFMMGIWDRYGRKTAQELGDVVRVDGAYALALNSARDTEITTEMLAAAYGGARTAKVRGGAKAAADPTYWTQTGKRATKWIPGQTRRA